MKVSLNWLRTMVDIPTDTQAFASRLDLTGTAVDAVYTTGEGLEGIVVGHILAREPHPNADSLWVTTVDVGGHHTDANGKPATLQIVCGAQNFEAGDKVPVALVGAVLPGGVRIKAAKLRGVESCGMNCSARELALGEDHAGLLILPADAPVGMPFAQYRGETDTIFDLEITPNRPDCMSMLGVAREVAAIYQKPYQLGRVASKPPMEGKVGDMVRVSIEDEARCVRYTARVIRGVTVGPSPSWLVKCVTAAGARSINNIVDITNYLMYETGQPLHVFDLGTLARDANGRVHIVVRGAAEGERLVTLDGEERVLGEDVTVIADGNAAGGAGESIALAGVMGGLKTEVTEATVDILLESAAFHPGYTSRTSRSLKLFSEASARYERGVDDAGCDAFSERAAALMVEVGGGTVAEGVVDTYPAPRTLIGAQVATPEALSVLTRLGCTVEPGQTPEEALVTPPSFRPDLEREIDLYEEVLRLWGMERVPASLPEGAGRIGKKTTEQQLVDKVGVVLRACGLNETMTYALTAADDLALLGMSTALDEQGKSVELINPLSSEQSHLRQSIVPGLLRSVAFNQARGVANVQLYELGTVFTAAEGRKQPHERQNLAAVLAGCWHHKTWSQEACALDFFDAKGIVENLCHELCVPKLRFVPLDANEAPWLAPGQAASIRSGGVELGWLGAIHPRSALAFNAKAPVIAFELAVKPLLGVALGKREFLPLSNYPAMQRDLALVVDKTVSAEKLLQVCRSAGGSLLAEVRLFDVFSDEQRLGAGKKSVALALSYRSLERTLTAEEVDKLHAKLVRKLEGATGGTLR